jgi:DNA-binding CsgD family transcriptional regulator/PAS domain-containing protein
MIDAPAESLLAEIYDAVSLENGWSSALDAVIRALDGDSGCLCWKSSTASPLADIASVGLDVPEYLNRYREEVERLNIPFYNLFRNRPVGDLVAFGVRAFDDDYKRSTFFNEWAKPLGFGDVVGCHLVREQSLYCWFSLRRDYRKGPFPADKLALGRSLVPHLTRSLKIWARLRSARRANSSLAAALDLLSYSVIIVDAEARILHANRSAERLLSGRDALEGFRGRLRCRYHDQDKVLRKAVHDASRMTNLSPSARVDRAVVLQKDDGNRLSIQLAPITPSSGWGAVAPPGSAVALFVSDGDTVKSRPLVAFAAGYGLTRMESRVLAEIVTGQGLPHVAETLQIGGTTARSHLQKIFLKTGTVKQAELVRLFLDQTVPMSQPEPP